MEASTCRTTSAVTPYACGVTALVVVGAPRRDTSRIHKV